MSWKDAILIFKPTPVKFLLFIVFFILALGLLQSTKYNASISENCLDCWLQWDACRYDYFLFLWPFARFLAHKIGSACPFGRFSGPSGVMENVFFTVDYQVFFIPHVFYWYLLSCLVLYALGKIRTGNFPLHWRIE